MAYSTTGTRILDDADRKNEDSESLSTLNSIHTDLSRDICFDASNQSSSCISYFDLSTYSSMASDALRTYYDSNLSDGMRCDLQTTNPYNLVDPSFTRADQSSFLPAPDAGSYTCPTLFPASTESHETATWYMTSGMNSTTSTSDWLLPPQTHQTSSIELLDVGLSHDSRVTAPSQGYDTTTIGMRDLSRLVEPRHTSSTSCHGWLSGHTLPVQKMDPWNVGDSSWADSSTLLMKVPPNAPIGDLYKATILPNMSGELRSPSSGGKRIHPCLHDPNLPAIKRTRYDKRLEIIPDGLRCDFQVQLLGTAGGFEARNKRKGKPRPASEQRAREIGACLRCSDKKIRCERSGPQSPCLLCVRVLQFGYTEVKGIRLTACVTRFADLDKLGTFDKCRHADEGSDLQRSHWLDMTGDRRFLPHRLRSSINHHRGVTNYHGSESSFLNAVDAVVQSRCLSRILTGSELDHKLGILLILTSFWSHLSRLYTSDQRAHGRKMIMYYWLKVSESVDLWGSGRYDTVSRMLELLGKRDIMFSQSSEGVRSMLDALHRYDVVSVRNVFLHMHHFSKIAEATGLFR